MTDYNGCELSRIIVLDTETTGLDPEKDEVLSLSIIDGEGNVLFDDLFRPEHRKRWPKAAEIHGITWNDVKDKETLDFRKYVILQIIYNADLVVGYNIDFDINMLRAGGLTLEGLNTFDVMKEYAKILPDKRWVKLIRCAQHYDYDFDPHNSLNDVYATLHCYKHLMQDDRYKAIKRANHLMELRIEEHEKNRTRNKLIGCLLLGVSIALSINSCNIGKTVSGTLLTLFISVVLFFIAFGFIAAGWY